MTGSIQSGTRCLFLLFNSLTTVKIIVQLFNNMTNQKLCSPLYLSRGWKGRVVSPPIKNLGLTVLSCLSSVMVRYSGILSVEEPHHSILNLVVTLHCGDGILNLKPKLNQNNLVRINRKIILFNFNLVQSSSGFQKYSRN